MGSEQDGRYWWNKRRGWPSAIQEAGRLTCCSRARILSSLMNIAKRENDAEREREVCAKGMNGEEERGKQTRRDEREDEEEEEEWVSDPREQNLSESPDNRHRSGIRLCSTWNNRRKRPLRIHERDSAWTLMHGVTGGYSTQR